MAKTLEEAKCKLKTQMGVSDEHHKHHKLVPTHGTGQGSSDSPMTWLFVSSVLFEVHTEKACGAHFVSFDGTKTTKIMMMGFVDDSAGCVAEIVNDATMEELIERMQHDAQ